jgi:hypothetical protein
MTTTPGPDAGDAVGAEVDAARAPGVVAGPCRNCGQPLQPAGARHCPHCGQATRLRAPTVGEFLHEFAGNFLALEGALWRTLKLLLLRPGELTCAYLAGRRLHYVRPLRLYLSISLVLLLGMGAAFKAQLEDAPPLLLDVPTSEIVVFDLGLVRAGLDRGRFFCEGLPASTCRRLQQRLATDATGLWQQATRSGQRAVGNLGTVMFVLVPVFALLLRVAYARGPWRYAEHLVFALHLHAFWFLVLAVALLGVPWLSQGVWLAMPAYALLAARQVYGGRWWTLLLRMAGVTLVYMVLLAVGLSLLLLWTILY